MRPPWGWPKDDDLSPEIVDMLAERLNAEDDEDANPVFWDDLAVANAYGLPFAGACGPSATITDLLQPTGGLVCQASCACGWSSPRRAYEVLADLDRAGHLRE